MPEEIDMLEDAEFENQINEMGDDQPALIKFVARQQFATSKVLVSHGKRIRSVEKQNKKMFGAVGLVSAAIVATIDYFIRLR